MPEEKSKKFISLGDVSRDSNLDIAKSKLIYYTKLGLLIPVSTIGKMFIFDSKDIHERLNKIKEMQAEGYSLKKIKEILNENNL